MMGVFYLGKTLYLRQGIVMMGVFYLGKTLYLRQGIVFQELN